MRTGNQRKDVGLHSNTLHHPTQIIPCSTVFSQKGSKQSALHAHPLTAKSEWLKPTKVLCWHCAHAFGGTPVYIPTDVTTPTDEECNFSVYGNFCSFPCAQAYLLEKASYDTPRQLLLLRKLAIDVYGEDINMTPAPPRVCLAAFGGDMSIEAFRGVNTHKHIQCDRPPFSATPMMIFSVDIEAASQPQPETAEDHNNHNYTTGEGGDMNSASWSVRDLKRPNQVASTRDSGGDEGGLMRFMKTA